MVEPFFQGLALDQLHHEKVPAAGLFHPVKRSDVRVIEGGEDLRFALEPCDAISIERALVGQDLYGDAATELRVARAVNFAHPTGPERRAYFIKTESRAGGHRHMPTQILLTN